MAPHGLGLMGIAHQAVKLFCSQTPCTRRLHTFTLPRLTPAAPFFSGFKVTPRKDFNGEPISSYLTYNGPDPGPVFMDYRVQGILKSLTGFNPERVYRHKKIKTLREPENVFLTDDQLEEERHRSALKASWLLRMPPVLQVREVDTSVICSDPALEGFPLKIVFTDITQGVPDNNRLIVVREHNGTLRHANADQRHRMNQLYNPREGKDMLLPEMFTTESFSDVLAREAYEFILEKASAQFEPDDALYQSVCARTYEAVDGKRHYDDLHSTRYYGPMMFFFAWHARMVNILEHFLKKERLVEAVDMLHLYMFVHPESKMAAGTNLAAAMEMKPLQLVKLYLAEESPPNSGPLELAITVCEEIQRNRQDFEQKQQQKQQQ